MSARTKGLPSTASDEPQVLDFVVYDNVKKRSTIFGAPFLYGADNRN